MNARMRVMRAADDDLVRACMRHTCLGEVLVISAVAALGVAAFALLALVQSVLRGVRQTMHLENQTVRAARDHGVTPHTHDRERHTYGLHALERLLAVLGRFGHHRLRAWKKKLHGLITKLKVNTIKN
jgi:hypothetical protein